MGPVRPQTPNVRRHSRRCRYVWLLWGGVTTRGSQPLVRDGHDLPFPRVLGSRGPS